MSQYIGKTISLISSKGIRYVGILDDVNGEEATVTLKNLKLFGTEGRLNDPSKEVAPSNEIYPVVVFRGSDVHDLSVLDDPVPTPTPSQQPTQSQTQQQPQPASQPTPAQNESSGSSSPEIPAPQPNSYPQQNQYQQRPRQNQYQQRPRQQQQQQQRNKAFYQETELPKNDFDFEQNNARFEEAATEGFPGVDGQQQSETPQEPAYDKKKSFFDTISNSNDEPRPERRNNNYGNRGGFRRGRGRGRGRGNYRGNNNNNNNPAWA